VGLARAAGFRPGPTAGTALITAGVLVGTNGPMTVLGITDPRTWSAPDWVSDLVPHLAYGVVVTTTLDAFDRPEPRGPLSASRAHPPRRAPAPRGHTACG
jgi:hypothetical protein